MAGGDVDEFGIIIIILGISGNSFSFLTGVGARWTGVGVRRGSMSISCCSLLVWGEAIWGRESIAIDCCFRLSAGSCA